MVDSEAPVVQAPAETEFEIIVGEEFALLDFTVTDNYDDSPTMSVAFNNVDKSRMDSYQVIITARDSSGYVSNKTFNYVVVLARVTYDIDTYL